MQKISLEGIEDEKLAHSDSTAFLADVDFGSKIEERGSFIDQLDFNQAISHTSENLREMIEFPGKLD